MDAYVTWREESAAARSMYQNWGSAARARRSDAFDAYLTALDGEERAACAYERLLKQSMP
jgi:hypothetical protein